MKYEIGARIRKFREQRGLSQKEFAQLIGMSNARVSNWEQGLNRPDVDNSLFHLQRPWSGTKRTAGYTH